MTNLEGWAAELASYEAAITGAMAVGVHTGGLFLEGRMKAAASGRPGPRAITGNFRRSITARPATVNDDTITSAVGSNAEQGPRLELGFTGPDSLGRIYDQPPYPWAFPTAERNEDKVVAIIERHLPHL